MDLQGTYVIGTEAILLKAYRLVGLFATNQVTSRKEHPELPDVSIKRLEARFFESELTSLLIETAVALRILFDQMDRLPDTDPRRQAFDRRSLFLAAITIMVIDPLPKKTPRKHDPTQTHPSHRLNLRFACNKIIHADTVDPVWQEGWEPHDWDLKHQAFGQAAREIRWRSLSGRVRLTGAEQKQPWTAILHIEPFALAISQLLME